VVFAPTPIRALVASLLFLAGAIGAVAVAQFAAAPAAPTIAIVYSGCAVVSAVLAMVLRLERRPPPAAPAPASASE
jgi:hypothetical protein